MAGRPMAGGNAPTTRFRFDQTTGGGSGGEGLTFFDNLGIRRSALVLKHPKAGARRA
jgi:hypothetical protein